MNESYHTCEWVMPHIWMSHITHVNESCHTFECVVSRMIVTSHADRGCYTTWMSRHTFVTHMKDVWQCHVWMRLWSYMRGSINESSNMSHMSESWHICDTSKWCVTMSYINESVIIYEWVYQWVVRHKSYEWVVWVTCMSYHTYVTHMNDVWRHHMWLGLRSYTNESIESIVRHESYE